MSDSDKLKDLIHKLYTNKYFINDAKKDYDFNRNIENKPLTEDDKKYIIDYLNETYDMNAIKRQYLLLIEMRRKHINSNFDFIPDKILNDKIEICQNYFCYNQPYLPVYASLLKEFKEVCRTPGKMPKIVKNIHITNNWDYNKFKNCVNEDGTYNLDETEIYFEE